MPLSSDWYERAVLVDAQQTPPARLQEFTRKAWNDFVYSNSREIQSVRYFIYEVFAQERDFWEY